MAFKTWSVAFAVLGVGGALGWGATEFSKVAQAPSAEEHQRSRVHEGNAAAVQGEVESLRKELAMVKQLSALKVVAGNASEVEPLEAIASPDETNAPSEDEWREGQAELLANEFAGQVRDEKFSDKVERQIDELFTGGAVTGTRLLEGRCASTMCRVQVQHDDDESRRRLSADIAQKEPFSYGVYYFYSSENGVHVTTMYAAREGHLLPAWQP